MNILSVPEGFKLRKLTPEQVDEIRADLESRTYRGQIVDLARKYGVSHATISQLKHGRRRESYK